MGRISKYKQRIQLRMQALNKAKLMKRQVSAHLDRSLTPQQQQISKDEITTTSNRCEQHVGDIGMPATPASSNNTTVVVERHSLDASVLEESMEGDHDSHNEMMSQGEDNDLEHFELEISTENTSIPKRKIVGRRIVDINFFVKQILEIASLGPLGCSSRDMELQIKGIHKVPSLAVLCGRVIKKYKLHPEPKKFAPPESFTIVGGKPLRKRSARLPPEVVLEGRRKKKSRNPRSLAALCQIVVKQYNLLPECEETIRPSTSRTSNDKNITKKRGRARKETKKEDQTKSRRGRPRKDATATATSEDNTSSTVTYVNYTTFLRQSQITRNIKVEEELNLPLDEDPLRQEDDDYTVVVKEEISDDEDTSNHEDPVTVHIPQGTSKGIVINPLASAEIPGPSRGPAAHFMTVVMDEYQVFANNIAQQLRALPPNRALLLQLDIQSMIDNEKQLLMHENCD